MGAYDPAMNTLCNHVQAYVAERFRRGEITALTARGYRNHLHHFAASYGLRPIENLSVRAVERWIEEMQADGLAPATMALRLSTLKAFGQWCAVRQVTRTDFTYGAPKIRRPRQIPRDMTSAHAVAVIEAARNPREYLITVLMFGAGLRCIEVHRLDVHDFDPLESTLFVNGKGGHQRIVPVTEVVGDAIHRYLRDAGHSSGPLVRCDRSCGRDGRLGYHRISGIVQYLTQLAGVKVRPFDGRSAHGLRSASATEVLEASGGDMRVAQQFLGHANVATTGIYIRRVSQDRVMAAQLQRPVLPRHAA